MAWTVIPAKQQGAGAVLGGPYVVMQAWPIANLYTLALLGPEGAKIVAGYGDWETIARPREVGITEWKGRRNYEMTIDLLYDGWITRVVRPGLPTNLMRQPSLPVWPGWASGGVHIEGMCNSLENLATVGRDMKVPPSLRVYGAVPHANVRWVIADLAWGDCIRDRVTGRRMRQQVTVHLLEYNQPTELAKLPRGKAATKK